MTLREILAPMDLEHFLRSHLGREYALIRGSRGRFRALAAWERINGSLRRTRVDGERLWLVKNGAAIPVDAYSYAGIKGRRYVDGPGLAQCLADGATLIMNHVDEWWPEARQLAESFEPVVGVRVSLNLYAGWGVDKGFTTHWDDHDTMICQIVGRKDWKVWAPAREHPLPEEVPPQPDRPPVWEGTLEDGDVLYLPRGWWHVAQPRNEASVHLTGAIYLPMGSDLLMWAVSDLIESRMSVPHWRHGEDKAAWIAALREGIRARLDDSVIDRYREALEDKARMRRSVHLPNVVTQNGAFTDHTPLRLRVGSRLHLNRAHAAGMVTFNCQGQQWTCPESFAPALGLLNHINPCTLDDMKQVIGAGERPVVRPFVKALLAARVIWAEPPLS